MSVSNRIRNEARLDTIALFVTLTYENKFVPYIKRSDLHVNSDKVHVYRDAFINRRGNVVDELSDLGEFDLPGRLHSSDIFNLKELSGKKGAIGVCYFKDVQDFVKRLRINLVRNYGFNETFSVFKCSEYGGHSQRPHFHLLIYIKPAYEEIFRNAIPESWPFGNKYESGRFIEVARDAASYVASYVNCGSSLSRVLAENSFRQKHSYSKGFGVSKECFSLSEILSKVRRNDLFYFSGKIDSKTGDRFAFPVPEYVINRYFPKFAGYSRLTCDEVFRVLSSPNYLFGFRNLLGLTEESVKKFVRRLYNCQQYYFDVTGNSNFDFASDYMRTWDCYNSTILKRSYEGFILEDFYEFYDNLDEFVFVYDGGVYMRFPSINMLEVGLRPELFKLNVHEHRHRILYDYKMSDLFRKRTKQKVVTNQIMSQFTNV